jgi:hypothetical protein
MSTGRATLLLSGLRTRIKNYSIKHPLIGKGISMLLKPKPTVVTRNYRLPQAHELPNLPMELCLYEFNSLPLKALSRKQLQELPLRKMERPEQMKAWEHPEIVLQLRQIESYRPGRQKKYYILPLRGLYSDEQFRILPFGDLSVSEIRLQINTFPFRPGIRAEINPQSWILLQGTLSPHQIGVLNLIREFDSETVANIIALLTPSNEAAIRSLEEIRQWRGGAFCNEVVDKIHSIFR